MWTAVGQQRGYKMNVNVLDRFRIDDKVCVITGGGGLMADSHARATLWGGGLVALIDISKEKLMEEKERLICEFDAGRVTTFVADITNRSELEVVNAQLVDRFGHVDILINNAANNPKVEGKASNMGAIRFDNLPLDIWNSDIAVGLTGAFLCSQVFGKQMEEQRSGVILNISSDLGVIAPDQRIYRKDGIPDNSQNVKPVTYSVIKHGLLGLTKYLATYWADAGIRCNAICPAGIENGQDSEFVKKLINLVPMGRMAAKDEYQATVLYMISDASAYMTGSTVIVDGGRTCW